jgi:F0F1-type ATP synthase membrane subunit b/b'
MNYVETLNSLITAQQATIQAQGEQIRTLRTEAITAQGTIEEQRETIKGLDRAGQRYKEIIEQYRKEALEMQKKIDEYEQNDFNRTFTDG